VNFVDTRGHVGQNTILYNLLFYYYHQNNFDFAVYKRNRKSCAVKHCQ